LKNLYKVLEIDESASKEMIQAAYKILAKRYHPDLCDESMKSFHEEKMKDINMAKDILLNDEKRAEYDIQLKKEEDKILNDKIQKKVSILLSENLKQQTKDSCDQKKEKIKFPSIIKKKNLILVCSLLFIFAILYIIIAFSIFIQPSNSTNNSPTKTVINQVELKPGMSKNDVMSKLGNPTEIASAYLRYNDAKILLSNDLVTGWIDTYKELPIKRHTTIPQINEIKTNTAVDDIIEVYGYPDSYSSKIITYDNIFIYLNNKKVSKVEEVKN
jgi:hypothetical protein